MSSINEKFPFKIIIPSERQKLMPQATPLISISCKFSYTFYYHA